MKQILFLCLSIFININCFAQDSTKIKNRLTETIVENYYVLKSDKKTKTGLYQAVYKKKVALASGNYVNDKKAGIWHFYDTRGALIENFDYDNNRLTYEKPDDYFSGRQIGYAFDADITDSDRVTKPIKPGGRYYAYLPFIKIFKLSDDFAGTDFSLFSAVLEILVSPGGRLADFKVHIKSRDFERITTFSPELLSDEDRIFLPATINQKPVLSRIFVKCRITDYGELDVY